jgi:hypothetical protein
MPKKAIAKGIVCMKDGRFEARVKYQGKSKDAVVHSIYIGMYETAKRAIYERQNFILNQLL